MKDTVFYHESRESTVNCQVDIDAAYRICDLLLGDDSLLDGLPLEYH